MVYLIMSQGWPTTEKNKEENDNPLDEWEGDWSSWAQATGGDAADVGWRVMLKDTRLFGGRVGHSTDDSRELGAYSSVGIAESSVGARQGAKTSASVNILTPTQPHLVHNSTLIKSRLQLITQLYLYSNAIRAFFKL